MNKTSCVVRIQFTPKSPSVIAHCRSMKSLCQWDWNILSVAWEWNPIPFSGYCTCDSFEFSFFNLNLQIKSVCYCIILWSRAFHNKTPNHCWFYPFSHLFLFACECECESASIKLQVKVMFPLNVDGFLLNRWEFFFDFIKTSSVHTQFEILKCEINVFNWIVPFTSQTMFNQLFPLHNQ